MNILLPSELVDEIILNNDIVEVVSEYVQLKKKGRNFFGNCPFHNEKTPSMSVSPDKQIFHCFGCGEGGNIVTFLMKIENIDFMDAIKILAQRAKIEIPEDNIPQDYKKKQKLKDILFNVNKEAAVFFYNSLMNSSGKSARDYLEKRGTNLDTIKKFGLGYSLPDWDSLNRHLLSKGFSQNTITNAGLSIKAKNGNYIDYFRNRIMFPIFDVYSNVIGFGGRILNDDGPKYLNTSETPVFNKGNNLYALNIVKKAKSDKIIIAEGYMDVIAMHQYGIDFAVATLGTALTENQAKLLRKYTDEIIIAFDTDNAGQAATLRSMELLRNTGLNIKVLQMPDGKDPDEFLKNNDANKFKYLINHSITYFQYLINFEKKKHNLKKVDEKIKFLNNMCSVLAKIDNNIERDEYIKILSRESNISEDSIIAQINKNYKNSNTTIKQTKNLVKPVENKNIENGKLDYAEKLLIYLISQDNVYERFNQRINVETFTIEENKKIFSLIADKLKENFEVNPSELMIDLSDYEINVVSKIFSREEKYDDFDKAINECINYINKYKRQAMFNNILNSSDSNIDIDKIKELDQLIRFKQS